MDLVYFCNDVCRILDVGRYKMLELLEVEVEPFSEGGHARAYTGDNGANFVGQCVGLEHHLKVCKISSKRLPSATEVDPLVLWDIVFVFGASFS